MLSSSEEVRTEMCAVETEARYVPRDADQFAIMLRHFRGAVVLDELVTDRKLFVSDLGFDPRDGTAALERVAIEKGWRK